MERPVTLLCVRVYASASRTQFFTAILTQIAWPNQTHVNLCCHMIIYFRLSM